MLLWTARQWWLFCFIRGWGGGGGSVGGCKEWPDCGTGQRCPIWPPHRDWTVSLSEGGGTVPQRPVCLSTPQNLNVTVSVREKKKGMDLEGWERGGGCRGGLFGRARTGRTQVIREADADASGGLGHGSVPQSSVWGKLGLFAFIS